MFPELVDWKRLILGLGNNRSNTKNMYNSTKSTRIKAHFVIYKTVGRWDNGIIVLPSGGPIFILID